MTVILRFFAEFVSFGADYVKVVEDRPIQSAAEMYSVSGKKETKMFLVISQTKLGRF